MYRCFSQYVICLLISKFVIIKNKLLDIESNFWCHFVRKHPPQSLKLLAYYVVPSVEKCKQSIDHCTEILSFEFQKWHQENEVIHLSLTPVLRNLWLITFCQCHFILLSSVQQVEQHGGRRAVTTCPEEDRIGSRCDRGGISC